MEFRDKRVGGLLQLDNFERSRLALQNWVVNSVWYYFQSLLLCCSCARTSAPIRPLVGFGIPTLESGNNAGTLTVLFPYLLYFCVPSRACKSLEFQIKVLCHGRGREFESRRPRHSFQKSCTDFDDTIENPEGTFRALFVSLYLIAREPVIRMSTNLLALCCQSGLDDM